MPEEKARDASRERSQFSDFFLPALAAIGTGIGVIGFVIFFGGFVTWTRFDAVGLPANEAVAQVPRNDLVATGADFLVPAFLAAFAAAALTLAGHDAIIGNRRRKRREILEEAVRAADRNLGWLLGKTEQAAHEIKWAEAETERLDAQPALKREGPDGDRARAAYAAAETRRNEREQWLQYAHVELIPKAKEEASACEQALEESRRHSKRESVEQALIGCAVMALAELFVIVSDLWGLPFKDVVLVGIAAVISIVVAIVVISVTKRFAWFIVCVFLGVGVTIAFATYERTYGNREISPFVALHAHHLPVTGFFVAETSDAVYLGRPEPDWKSSEDLEFRKDGSTLVRYPKESLSAISIGPLLDETDAFRRSTHLALMLCRGSTEAGSRKSGREPRCNPAAVRRLHVRLAMIRAHG